jgi:hypothetical protein
MQNQQAQAQKPQENPWTGPAHGSSAQELAMFKSGKKPVSVQLLSDPAWKELADSGKYPTEIIRQAGKPAQLVIGQPNNQDGVYKVHKLVQTATDRGEAGDFSPYQNPKYHKLLGQLLGYSDSQIDSFMSHYFKDKTNEVADPKDPSEHIAIHNQGLEIPIASKYAGDGQFKVTVKNKPYIVTVAGFEINPLDPGILDSFYLTDVATGKTHHVTGGWDPVAVAIFNNLDKNQKPALKDIYQQDMAFYDEHDWDGSRPERLQGLALSGYNSIPADRFIKGHQDMKKVTGQDLDEKKLGQLRPKLGTARDVGKSVRKFRSQRGLDEAGSKQDNKQVDIKASMLLKRARAAHPLAQSDAEALAMYFLDKEESDVDRLDQVNDREDRMIDRLDQVEQDLQRQIDKLQGHEKLKEGPDLLNMSDLQFYKELLAVLVIPVAGLGAAAWNRAQNALKLYRAEDVINALNKKGITVDRATLGQIKPLLLKLEQAIDVDRDGDAAKELAQRIQQTVTWGKLKQAPARPATPAQGRDEQGVAEAANPAQQAAIAIAMKRAGKKPKHVDEGSYTGVMESQGITDPKLLEVARRIDAFTKTIK